MKSTFTDRLQKSLDACGMRQVDLAEKTGIHPGTISNYIRGKYEPKDDKLQIIADALGVSVSYLAGFTNDPKSGLNEIDHFIDQFTRMTQPGSFGPVTVSIDDVKLIVAYHEANPRIQSAVRKLLDLPEESS